MRFLLKLCAVLLFGGLMFSCVAAVMKAPHTGTTYDYAGRQREESLRSLTDDVHRLTDRAVQR